MVELKKELQSYFLDKLKLFNRIKIIYGYQRLHI